MFVKFARPSGRSAGDNDEQKCWEEASRLEEATRDLLSRNPEGLKGSDVANFGLRIGGTAATRPEKHRRTQSQDAKPGFAPNGQTRWSRSEGAQIIQG